MQTLHNIFNFKRATAKPVTGFAVVLGTLFLLLCTTIMPDRAFAAHCVSCSCVSSNHALTQAHIRNQHQLTRTHIADNFEQHRQQFIVLNFFKHHVMTAMMMMTEQLTTASMGQLFMIGAFFDAEIQLDTARKMQELTAKAHKDYQPSFQMCTIGTTAKNLGYSRRLGELAALTINEGLMDRQTLHHRMAAAGGTGMDSVRRWDYFIRNFCEPRNNGASLRPLCIAPAQNPQVNIDVDYTRTIDHPLTVSSQFVNSNLQGHEAGVFALGSNLYGADLIDFKADALFDRAMPYADEFMRVRSVLAKRSVAINSYANIAGMKTNGPRNMFRLRLQHMRFIMEQLGMSNTNEITQVLGGRPSYHAQMEFLTKKIYQRPEFYTNLYDKPANVDRTRAAMRAIGLMQRMDMYNSRLRSEMLLSVAAELGLIEEQSLIEDALADRPGGVMRP